jgi:hypothetical protein
VPSLAPAQAADDVRVVNRSSGDQASLSRYGRLSPHDVRCRVQVAACRLLGAVKFCMMQLFATGTVLTIDGGTILV